MKILAVSLLRLGDLVLLAPALAALKRQFPQAELHLLTNHQNAGIAKIMACVDRVHYFDRDLVQKSLGDVGQSVFEAEDRIISLIRRMNRYDFDMTYNFTHNRLSGYFVGAIASKQKFGMQMDSTGRLFIESNWFKFLNNFAGHESKHLFHYSDFFRLVVGGFAPFERDGLLAGGVVSPSLTAHQRRIVLNPWSSDEKKDWSDQSWVAFMVEINKHQPGQQFTVLAGPAEQDKLSKLITLARENELSVDGLVLKFDELLTYLDRQDLLLTVDTAVKHVAALTNIKIIELALGSSSPVKTGVYSKNNIVVQSTVACSPCSHFSKCHRTRHECGLSLDPVVLAAVALELQRGHWPNIRVLADEYKEQLQIYKTCVTNGGFWFLRPLSSQSELETFDHLTSLAGWKVALDKSYLDPLFDFSEVAAQFRTSELQLSGCFLASVESSCRTGEMEIDRISSQFAARIKPKAAQGLKQSLAKLESSLGLESYLTQHLANLESRGLAAFRQIQEGLNQLRQYQIAKLKVHQESLKQKEML